MLKNLIIKKRVDIMQVISDAMTIIFSVALLVIFLLVGFSFTHDKSK